MILQKNEQEEKNILRSLVQIEIDSRIIFLSGAVDKDTAYKTVRSLLLLDEMSYEPIKLFVNSPGGEINSGFSIFDCIRFIRSKVYIIGAGLVASAAALIYTAVPKEQRISFSNSRYLLHQPLSGMRGVVTDLEIYSKEIEEHKKLINEIISKATEKEIEQVEKDTDRDFWLTTKAAVDYGLVGLVVNSKEDLHALFPEKKPEKPEKKSVKKTSKSTEKSTAKKISSAKSAETPVKKKASTSSKTKDVKESAKTTKKKI